MHREKYDLQPEPRTSLSEKFASYYGSLRTMWLGSNLAGRRTPTVQENPFAEDAELTAFQKAKEEGILKPKTVELHRTLNRTAHRTQDYEIPNLILRRGQDFTIKITFERMFVEREDQIHLKFVTGSRPLQSKGSVVSVNKTESPSKTEWGFSIVEILEKGVTLKVSSAPDSIVGRYQLFIDTEHCGANQTEPEKYRYKHPDDIYLIFNPWCEGDCVYLDDENQREEYVLRETGRIWLGTVGKFCVRPWNFAQFDDVCLVAALAMLEKSELGDPARNNPILIVRSICKVINNNERDGGVLFGNWSGKYDDGVAPYAWNGSSAILEEFLKKRKGVKYGQCWTFSAVTTTILRALGIPTRCISNFRSAHDSDYSSSIDAHWTVDGRPRKTMDDAIWDFHVWNESWFKRPDLPDGHDGWQAYDPTPQECTEGVFTCGPVSVKAIKRGELYFGSDARFLYAEVNGSRTHWTVDADGNMTPFLSECDVIGKNVSTKAAGTISREDLTSAYKHKEGSQEHAAASQRAKAICFRRLTPADAKSPDDLKFVCLGESTKAGDVSVTMKVQNDTAESRVVDIYLSAVASFYTGVPSSDIKDTASTIVIEPSGESEVSLKLHPTEYINSSDADTHVNVYAHGRVNETGQRFAAHDVFWIEKPQLEVKSEGKGQLGKPFEVVVKLVNTLSLPLTGGVLNIEGPGIQRVAAVKIKKNIAAGEEHRETIKLNARRVGRKEIIANFYCKQICDVTGVGEIDIYEENKV
ncbi:hemocyte protein-glutamine gamma-glutamyltransferase-like isoform X2 [Gigantopelta aegis]|uniref:hemocyte protein-glutamine gamma-glutamyltransferase-like isoform X2 n=1 Tax=Gigantopelta aegis TaxID=1735272 RepID=UPI001B88A280|nr:hemocyte protein-glutamine gamma-glutamyltransferase-like isoform X2 [Gigantopelta aegis]